MGDQRGSHCLSDLVKANVIPGYVDANLIGAARVFFFQNNSFMGSMVLIAILWRSDCWEP
jgi:urea transporter